LIECRELPCDTLAVPRDGWPEQPGDRSRVLPDLEQDAQAARRGLWADPRPPWEWEGGAAGKRDAKNGRTSWERRF